MTTSPPTKYGARPQSSRAALGQEVELKLFTTIYDDARLLQHFLAHYELAGVNRFLIAVTGELEFSGSTIGGEVSDHPS